MEGEKLKAIRMKGMSNGRNEVEGVECKAMRMKGVSSGIQCEVK